jgi:hypothetical protein
VTRGRVHGDILGTRKSLGMARKLLTDARETSYAFKFRVGGFVQTAFWKVRSEPFGSRLCLDGSSERKSPGSAECESGPIVGSRFGSNLPVLLAAFSGLNGVESTDCFKVNSRMLYR